MGDEIYLKATVTGKRQITIPKEICDRLHINTGDQVLFKAEDKKIFFEVDKSSAVCFACKGTARIFGSECFICSGTGRLEQSLLDDIYKLIGVLIVGLRKYGICVSFMQRFDEFPNIRLIGTEYKAEDLLRIQDEIQKLIIEQFAPKSSSDKSLFCIPSDKELESILDTLSTDEAREEVTRWFRYERTI